MQKIECNIFEHCKMTEITSYEKKLSYISYRTDELEYLSQNIQARWGQGHSCTKNHIREEGGVHLRISFWHLLMNLKSKYLFKKLLK